MLLMLPGSFFSTFVPHSPRGMPLKNNKTLLCFCSNSSAVLAPSLWRGLTVRCTAQPIRFPLFPPLDLPQAQLPGKTFTIKCETRRLLPRESWRRGCWLRTTTVWNFFAVCHTRRKMKADVGTGGEGGEEEREGERKQSPNAARSDKKSCRNKSTAVSARQNMLALKDANIPRDINSLIG